jgi:hypothetical protein
MKKVYFKDCGTLYRIGKVRKDYKIGDKLKLKSCICQLIVIDVLPKEIHVYPAA